MRRFPSSLRLRASLDKTILLAWTDAFEAVDVALGLPASSSTIPPLPVAQRVDLSSTAGAGASTASTGDGEAEVDDGDATKTATGGKRKAPTTKGGKAKKSKADAPADAAPAKGFLTILTEDDLRSPGAPTRQEMEKMIMGCVCGLPAFLSVRLADSQHWPDPQIAEGRLAQRVPRRRLIACLDPHCNASSCCTVTSDTESFDLLYGRLRGLGELDVCAAPQCRPGQVRAQHDFLLEKSKISLLSHFPFNAFAFNLSRPTPR